MTFDFPDTNGLADGFRVTNPKTGTEYTWRASSQKWVLINSAVSGDYVKKSGDIMAGPLLMTNGDLLNPGPINIVQDEQAVHKFYVDDAITAIPPTDLSDYATEVYVDDAIAAIPPVDLTDYATEQYVDDAIEDAVEILDDKIDNLPPHVGQYVKKVGGDSMQGPLQVTGNRDANASGVESTIKVLNIDSDQSSSLNLKYKGATKVYVGEKDFILAADLKFNTGGKAIYAEGSKKGFVVNSSGVFYDGTYTNDRHIATKKNVDDAIALIGVDGEKEGLFTWDASSTDLPVGTWQFEGRSNPSYTADGVQVINIQKQDKNGLTFSDTDFAVGGQIEIKNVGNDDYLLGTVTAIVDGGPKSVQITFSRNSASGQATGDQTIKTVTAPQPYVNNAWRFDDGRPQDEGQRPNPVHRSCRQPNPNSRRP